MHHKRKQKLFDLTTKTLLMELIEDYVDASCDFEREMTNGIERPVTSNRVDSTYAKLENAIAALALKD